jgi:hypothetical protein
MSAPIRASGRDLCALAAIVSQDRPDPPDGEVLPLSLLADLMARSAATESASSALTAGGKGVVPAVHPGAKQRRTQGIRGTGPDPAWLEHVWACHWDCQSCSYLERTGDLRSVVKPSDFYSARQWHSTGMYSDCLQPQGYDHQIQLSLPDPAGLSGGPGRTVRMYLFRGPGPDFTERDRAMLTLPRPRLHQACLDAEQRRHPMPRLTPRQNDLLRLVAARAHQHPDRPPPWHLRGNRAHPPGNIYERLQVSSRTAAVTRAFPGRVA